MTDKKLSNLERIRLAWSWGWSAIVRYDMARSRVFLLNGKACLIDDDFHVIGEGELNGLDLVSYLYAGQLAGSEPIPEGQRFRVKRTGGIRYYDCSPSIDMVALTTKIDGGDNDRFDKSEIEPYFD